ncbi:hypothetical protein DMJ13_20615 [halophilic archaeon]|nr:hypothetical protein DMJ13_20615 [halophilic archaeon]
MQNFLIRLISVTADKVQSKYEEMTEAIQDKERKLVWGSVSRMINLVWDYDSAEGVDDSPDLAAEAANIGRQRFETVEQSCVRFSAGYRRRGSRHLRPTRETRGP